MLKFFRLAFWPEEPNYDVYLDECSTLEKVEEDVAEPPVEAPVQQTDYTCHTRTGFVTSAKDGVYTIDHKYEFSYNLPLSVGMEVSFTMYRAKGEIKVCEVTVLDQWGKQFTGEQSRQGIRSLICQVVERKGRKLYVDPHNICIDLNIVAAEFIPIVGDSIEVQAKLKFDDSRGAGPAKKYEVEKIFSVDSCNLEGTVRRWDSKAREGVIDRDVFFDGDALKPGYVPIVGDKVLATVIRSDQGWFKLRALNLIPEDQISARFTLDSTADNFLTEKRGVFISGDVSIVANKINDTYRFEFEIKNQTSTPLTLLDVKIASLNPQCEIWEPMVLTDIKLESGCAVTFQGTCKATNMGLTRDLILFQFPDCNIGRYVLINLQSINTHYSDAVNNGYKHRPAFLTTTQFNSGELVPGVKLSEMPRFVHNKLLQFPVPKHLYDLVESHEQHRAPKEMIEKLGKVKPNLPKPLTYETYEDRFHTLLNLEEIYGLLAIKGYADDCTRFTKKDNFLVLTIENLSEKRPTLMMGDKILAKDPYNSKALEYEGFIGKVDSNHVYLKFDESYHQKYRGEEVSVMVVASRMNFRRMHHAVSLAIKHLGKQFLFPTRVTEVKPQVKFDYERYSDQVLLQEDEKENLPCKPLTKKQLCLEALRIHASRDSKEQTPPINNGPVQSQLLLDEPSHRSYTTDRRPYQKKYKESERGASISLPTPKLEWLNKNLNYFQKEAVRNILLGVARPLPYIIFGPPGTGKTVTLVETILQILRLIPHSRLLVATPSNSAADLIALRLVDSGLLQPGDLIRLVAYRCVVDNYLPTKLAPYCATVDFARVDTRGVTCKVKENGVTEAVNSVVISRHRIAVGTCSSLGILFHLQIPAGHFTHVIIDEAAQAVEPEIMIPVTFVDPKVGQIVLAGDPLQLGPVISSKGAGAYRFDITFLDRLLSTFPYIRDARGLLKSSGYDPRLITRLVYNYRSLPQILTLVNDMFYDGQLIATISPTKSKQAGLLTKVKKILPTSKVSGLSAVVFQGVIGDNLQTPDCPSWFNPNEAAQIVWWIEQLYNLGLTASDIGVISPYVKQARTIRALLVDAKMDLPKIGTVEEFQGQEFNVILLSTVRSDGSLTSHDMKFKLGFLSNPRRVNVAISRAQALMVIVGNPHLLCNDLHWRNVIKYCVEKGAYCGCDLPK